MGYFAFGRKNRVFGDNVPFFAVIEDFNFFGIHIKKWV